MQIPENLPKEAFSHPSSIIGEFACRGVALISPDDLGLSADVHKRVYEQELLARDQHNISPESVPAILEILRAPGLIASVNQLVGENWAIVPFTHNAAFESGAHDQMWHKDDNGPFNARKQRHHQSIQLEMLYYPQDVSPLMGPTAIIPYAHYWTFNHEENQDNFAGADHLDFDYMTSGMERKPVSGPNSEYSKEDILNGATAHDLRMSDAVTNTGWPLPNTFQAAPLKAGSVVLYSHNTFHRGNHRRDDHQIWKDQPRFMWRFFIYRTTDSFPQKTVPWNFSRTDPLTGIDLKDADSTVTECWRYHEHWMTHGESPPPRKLNPSSNPTQEAQDLYQSMLKKDDANEALRIGSAYLLASLPDLNLALNTLEKALYIDRENVRRASTYGLVALGSAATPVFLKACQSTHKWIRRAGVYGLGSIADAEDDVLNTLCHHLRNDTSLYVRSVCADALGCLLRRSISHGVDPKRLRPTMDHIIQCLQDEENRTSMDRVQKRSIKYVRPTDDQDVCEGGAPYHTSGPFQPVRSIVKENLLWSMVMICSHHPKIFDQNLESCVHTLKDIIAHDKNILSVGFAIDALTRLTCSHIDEEHSPNIITTLKEELKSILRDAPSLPYESLVSAGVEVKDILDLIESRTT
jgi:ectoine hydroxylase-related dioxygenase (phytanoyl-CoA dioxygenase family)